MRAGRAALISAAISSYAALAAQAPPPIQLHVVIAREITTMLFRGKKDGLPSMRQPAIPTLIRGGNGSKLAASSIRALLIGSTAWSCVEAGRSGWRMAGF